MSLIDGLMNELKNPLAENDTEMDFVFESAFDIALEQTVEKHLSDSDIAAILAGIDDVDDEEDDLDDPSDDIATEGIISRKGRAKTESIEDLIGACEAALAALESDTFDDDGEDLDPTANSEVTDTIVPGPVSDENDEIATEENEDTSFDDEVDAIDEIVEDDPVENSLESLLAKCLDNM